jgi:hypothetical protein
LKKILLTLTVGLLAIAVLQCSQGDKKVHLRLKYTQGETLHYKQTGYKTTQVFENDSLVKTYSVSPNYVITEEVLDIKGDITTVLETIISQKGVLKPDDTATVMDTSEWKEQYTFSVQPNGKVLNMDWENIESDTRIAYLQNYYEQIMPIFPSEEVSPGFSWTQTTKVVLPDDVMEASTTYRVKSMVRESGYDCVVIEYDGTLLIPLKTSDDEPELLGGLDSIEASGVIYFAYQKGLTVLLRQRLVIDGYREITREGKAIRRNIKGQTDAEYALVKIT